MAKNYKWYKVGVVVAVIGLLITFISIALATGKTVGKLQEKQKTVELTKVEGCLPARATKQKVGIIEHRLDSIDEKQEKFAIKQEEFSVEQTERHQETRDNFEEILKRLPE